MASKRRVVVTGLGMITPLGTTVSQNWQALVESRSGLQKYPNYKPTLPVGLVTGEQDLLTDFLSVKDQRKLSRFIQLGLIAACEALHDAGVDQSTEVDRSDFGAYIGVGIGGLDVIDKASKKYNQRGPQGVSPFVLPMAICNEAPSWISKLWNLQGPSAAITNACSSGADAIGLAFRAIRDGYANAMIAGGTEASVVPIALASFGNMHALTSWQGDATQASRPFDKERSGFVMAEGAGMLVLQTLQSAQQQDAKIYAEIVGYGATADAYHMTAMHPEARGAKAAMQKALNDADIESNQVGYINAHGTGTQMNDVAETLAIQSVFGDYALPTIDNHLLVSSTKSMTGHMLGAAGGVEIGYTALALQQQIAPPTINRTTPDPACNIDCVASKPKRFSSDYALSNSFGFGGCNASILLKRWI